MMNATNTISEILTTNNGTTFSDVAEAPIVRAIIKRRIERYSVTNLYTVEDLISEVWIKTQNTLFDGPMADCGIPVSLLRAIASAASQAITSDFSRRSTGKRGGANAVASIEAAAEVKDTEVDHAGYLKDGLDILSSHRTERTVFGLRFIFNMKNEEIAATLGIHKSAVERRWVNAKAILSAAWAL